MMSTLLTPGFVIEGATSIFPNLYGAKNVGFFYHINIFENITMVKHEARRW